MRIARFNDMAENAIGFTLWCGIAMLSDNRFSLSILLLCLCMYYTIFVIDYLIKFHEYLSDVRHDKKTVICYLPPTVIFSCSFIYYFGMFQIIQNSYCESKFLNFVIKGSAYLTITLCDVLIGGIYCVMISICIQCIASGVDYRFRNVFICTMLVNVLIFVFSLRYSLDCLFYYRNQTVLDGVFEVFAALASIGSGLSISLTIFCLFIETIQLSEHTDYFSKEYQRLKNCLKAGLVSEILAIMVIVWMSYADMIPKEEEQGYLPALPTTEGSQFYRFYLMLAISAIQFLALTAVISRMLFIKKALWKEEMKFSGPFYIQMGALNNKIGTEKVLISIFCDRILGKKPMIKKFTLPEDCCICLGQYQNGEHIMVLKCGHVLHKNCYDYLLSSEENIHIRCPLCRKILEELS